MSQSQDKGPDRLSQLPNELLVDIFQRCSNFSALWSLLNTSSLLRAVFNQRAVEIVTAVLNSTVPVQTRIIMRQVLALHTGSISYDNYAEARCSGSNYSQLQDRLNATPEQLRGLVRLSHNIHVIAHVSISKCIQNCLESPLGEQELPGDFQLPTWTEEQRAILASWRVIFLNELKMAAGKGKLHWSTPDLKRVKRWGLHQHLGQWAILYPALAAQEAIEKNPEIPERVDFGWVCQPAPSLGAVDQERWKLANQPRYHTPQPSPEADSADSSDEYYTDEFDSEPEGEEGEHEEGEESANEESESESPGTQQPSPKHLLKSSSVSGPIVSRIPPEIKFPVRPLSWHAPPRHIQIFGQDPPGQEWQNLDAATLGVQFWGNMVDDPNAGDARFMFFEAYLKYGLAIWEEQRMIDLGLWSREAATDPSEYFRRWYDFLSDEDILLYSSKYQNNGNGDDEPGE